MKKPLIDSLSFSHLLSDKTCPGDWFSSLPILETDHLILRKLRLRDAADIYSWSSDPKVARYVLWDAHRSISDSREYIRYVRRLYRSGLPSSWGIELKETGHIIGTIGLMWYSDINSSAEVGYSLSAEYWNHGYMTEALLKVLDFCFDDLKLNRIEAQFDIRNSASGRVMEKCGLRQEGILRARIRNKNEFIDVALFAILAEDRKNKNAV